jgi:hypothetical protein
VKVPGRRRVKAAETSNFTDRKIRIGAVRFEGSSRRPAPRWPRPAPLPRSRPLARLHLRSPNKIPAQNMPYTRKLSAQITLHDGRVITTLRDVADFALTLTDRQKADLAWQYVIELMMKAARTGATTLDLQAVERQLHTVLKADGLIGIRRDRPWSRPR